MVLTRTELELDLVRPGRPEPQVQWYGRLACLLTLQRCSKSWLFRAWGRALASGSWGLTVVVNSTNCARNDAVGDSILRSDLHPAPHERAAPGRVPIVRGVICQS